MRIRSLLASVLVAGMCLAVVPAASAAAATGSSCQDVYVPVSVVAGTPQTDRVYGELCSPSTSGSVLQILVHGITYDHHYWDFPGFAGRYSYADYMNKAGYPTLALDRIGSGRSSHPLSAAVTVSSNARVLHQVVQAARSGQIPGGPYDSIVLVGHSYGTLTSELAAATYHDVDGVIGTGWLHLPGVVQTAGLASRLLPAGLDPKFPELLLDPGYLTSRPGTRSFFYQTGNYDPAVLAADEALKQTATVTEFATFAEPALIGSTNSIRVPTLLIVGEHDVFFCGELREDCSTSERVQQSQAPYWSDEAQLRTHVQPGAGHDVALELNNHDGFDAQLAWLREFFPSAS